MTLSSVDPGGKVLSWLAQVDVLGWALIAAAAALTVLTWRGVVGRARVGTIEVEPIKTDAGTNLTVVAATAELQKELAKCGLQPSGGVPAGSPTAGIVAAVEAAPIAQAQWLARLIELLPIPPGSRSFKISSTLVADGHGRRPVGLTYKIIEVGTGTCVAIDTEWCADARKAIHAGADAIYRAILEHAVDAFPVWARWSDPRALERYRDGLASEKESGSGVERRYASALEHFDAASRLDPNNMLVRLRMGNCLERLAGCQEASDGKRVKRWVEALDAYAAVRLPHPEIFQSRYRMSVVMGLVADHPHAGDSEIDEALRTLLKALEPDRALPVAIEAKCTSSATLEPDHGRPPAEVALEQLRKRVRATAKRESKAAWKRLRPLWICIHERRLRHQFEPTGTERRQLRKALAMSFMCLRLRRHWHQPFGDAKAAKPTWGLRAAPRVFWRGWVYWRYLAGRLRTAGWQAQYNAAAFYALLPETSIVGNDGIRSQRLRDRAFMYLMCAIEDPGHELRCAYVRDEDTDLEILRRLEKVRWRTDVADRLCGAELLLHYRRADGAYDLWGAELSGAALSAGGVTRAHRPLRYDVKDDFGALFRIAIHDRHKSFEFLLRKGKECDGDARHCIPAQLEEPQIWVIADDPRIYVEQPPNGLQAADAPAATAPV